MSRLFIFGVIILLTLISSINSQNDEISTLISFKNSISKDPKNVLQNWFPNSSSPCSFSGITCSENHVVSIDLSNNSLSGKLNLSKLTNLPFLKSLNLAENNFSGDFSGEAPSKCNLETLNLYSNNFSTPLNLSICTKLWSLNLSKNNIRNAMLTFPPSISILDLSVNSIRNISYFSSSLSKIQNLNFLNISYNGMNGDLAFLSKLPKTLKTLDISTNNFTHNLEDFQFSCKNFSVLNLSNNSLFSSVFPSNLMSCELLEELNLGHNRLRFEIPGNLFGNLKNLKRLNLASNQMFGEIPFQLGKDCRNIEKLDLSNNNLVNELPSSFSNCLSLVSLNLTKNQLSGGFGIIDPLLSLRYIYLSFNNLTGNVPLAISNNSRLLEIDLSANRFNGKIPFGFCLSSSSPVLEKLLLADNNFSGTIPPDLGKCKNLREIDFSFNELSGEIPIQIWNLPKISNLVTWANKLTGELPEGFCVDGGNLQMLILNNNLISGNIPPSISNCRNLIWLSLSSNQLTGTIPPSIQNLKNLAILQLGNNSLSGEIPSELGNLSSLIWLELNSNEFHGEIPHEIAQNTGFIKPGAVAGKEFRYVRNEGGNSCRGVGTLVLFRGIRTERLQNFPMVHLCPKTRIFSGYAVYTFETNGSMIYLDLSYNALAGKIPEIMGSMSFMAVLNLGHNNLTGTIPSSFGGLKGLGVLDLSYNNLEGIIPASLGGCSFLTDLDISNNHLTGEIPSGGQLTTFPPSRYENNRGLCGTPLPACVSGKGPSDPTDAKHGQGNKEALIVEMVVGVVTCLICIFAIIFVIYRTRRKRNKERKEGKYIKSLPTSGNSSWKLSGVAEPLSINIATFENPLRKLTFAHLLKATNGFSSESLIGTGGFGEVYKAQLKDGSIVAIKKLVHATSQGEREFMAEMETIGKIRHRNLVPLLGYCKVGEERLLVYDYMKWGSLESVLHENKGSEKLDWASRKKIAIGSARGLAFLHHSCIPHIIHRDMKSSNVLLDENFEAKVSDFGMARLVNALDSHLSVSTLAGTPGYVPPEYYQSFRCTPKGDVYSYGVILLELLSGKRPIDPSEFGEDNNLVGWAKQLQKEKKMHEILDPDLVSKESTNAELYQCLKIAFECLDDRHFRRPTMIEVLSMFRDLHTDSDGDVHDDVTLKSMSIEERQEKET